MKSGITLVVLMGLLLSQYAQAASLVVYSGRKDQFIKPVVAEFTKETGIKVLLHSGSSTSLLNKLKLEGDNSTADLFISNDAGNLEKGKEMDLFLPVSQTIANAIPQNLRASDNSWIGLSARARVLVKNTNDKSADFVTSVFDLADPRLKGKLGITHSGNESYIAGVTVYMASAGKEKTSQWLAGMKENIDGKVFNKHSKIVKAVADGKRSVGLVNHYYIYRHLEKHPKAPIKIVLPDQGANQMGVAWNVAGIAIAKYSKNKQDAERFIAFVTSEKGQSLFAEVNSEYPAREGVPAAAEVPKAGSYKVAPVAMPALGQQRNATLDLIEKVGMP
ncbi:MAG: extracellular solute-binding protein [Gammaproteobacteria bacterium]|nr:extracellular solute-binding protein [Gammaproteobacteria bacterium]MCW8988007.1 extracellular solute-binding protein [Gammaproteobacteria bacterium]MCW9032008.1 extracellular solute-binding protein [Gammaproteobacteria bacterium]